MERKKPSLPAVLVSTGGSGSAGASKWCVFFRACLAISSLYPYTLRVYTEVQVPVSVLLSSGFVEPTLPPTQTQLRSSQDSEIHTSV